LAIPLVVAVEDHVDGNVRWVVHRPISASVVSFTELLKKPYNDVKPLQ
jgi:hypothetical protein